MEPLQPVPLDDVRAAAERIRDVALRTPLLPLEAAAAEIHLKLENLQPIGSFKLRGAANTVAVADPRTLAGGIGTASAGNMGRAVAWLAHQRGISVHGGGARRRAGGQGGADAPARRPNRA